MRCQLILFHSSSLQYTVHTHICLGVICPLIPTRLAHSGIFGGGRSGSSCRLPFLLLPHRMIPGYYSPPPPPTPGARSLPPPRHVPSVGAFLAMVFYKTFCMMAAGFITVRISSSLYFPGCARRGGGGLLLSLNAESITAPSILKADAHTHAHMSALLVSHCGNNGNHHPVCLFGLPVQAGYREKALGGRRHAGMLTPTGFLARHAGTRLLSLRPCLPPLPASFSILA